MVALTALIDDSLDILASICQTVIYFRCKAAMPVNGRWIPSKKRRVLDRGGGLASNPGVLFSDSHAGDDHDNEPEASTSSLALEGRSDLFR